jgi:hypothetical protein
MFLRGIDGAGVRGRTRTEDREATEDFSNGLIDRGRFWAGASPRRGATSFQAFVRILLPKSNGLEIARLAVKQSRKPSPTTRPRSQKSSVPSVRVLSCSFYSWAA